MEKSARLCILLLTFMKCHYCKPCTVTFQGDTSCDNVAFNDTTETRCFIKVKMVLFTIFIKPVMITFLEC